jgi:hypothetical protein
MLSGPLLKTVPRLGEGLTFSLATTGQGGRVSEGT